MAEAKKKTTKKKAKATSKKQIKEPKKRLSKYDTHVLPKLTLIAAWARDGVIDKDIALKLGVAYSTFREYVKTYSALSSALKDGKEVADVTVENALYKKALGYNAQVKKTFKCKVTEYDKDTGKKVLEYEELREGYDEVHVAADTTAQIFWLKNRRPEKWSDKYINENMELSMEDYLKKRDDDIEY